MAFRKKSRSYRSRSGSNKSYRPKASRGKRRYSVKGGGARTIRLQIVQQAPQQPQPMAFPGVGHVMPAGPPAKATF